MNTICILLAWLYPDSEMNVTHIPVDGALQNSGEHRSSDSCTYKDSRPFAQLFELVPAAKDVMCPNKRGRFHASLEESNDEYLLGVCDECVTQG